MSSTATVLLTVLSGVLTYIVGQLITKLILDPVHDMRKTIGLISHTLVERAHVIGNPGVPAEAVMKATSEELRKLSSQLHSHLYLVPSYDFMSRIFRLPSRKAVLEASGNLIGLSNSIFKARERIHEINASRIVLISDSLGIYVSDEDRAAARP